MSTKYVAQGTGLGLIGCLKTIRSILEQSIEFLNTLLDKNEYNNAGNWVKYNQNFRGSISAN